MERTKLGPKALLLKSVKHHILSVNKVLTMEHLDGLGNMTLLANCHPINRRKFAEQMWDLNMLTEAEWKVYKKKEEFIYAKFGTV